MTLGVAGHAFGFIENKKPVAHVFIKVDKAFFTHRRKRKPGLAWKEFQNHFNQK